MKSVLFNVQWPLSIVVMQQYYVKLTAAIGMEISTEMPITIVFLNHWAVLHVIPMFRLTNNPLQLVGKQLSTFPLMLGSRS